MPLVLTEETWIFKTVPGMLSNKSPARAEGASDREVYTSAEQGCRSEWIRNLVTVLG